MSGFWSNLTNLKGAPYFNLLWAYSWQELLFLPSLGTSKRRKPSEGQVLISEIIVKVSGSY
jgi:hypothetical protein